MQEPGMRIVAVSNRLPVSLKREEGGWRIHPGSGGLVTALAPILRNRGGLWIGWPGTSEKIEDDLKEVFESASVKEGYSLVPVTLTADEIRNFYYGFSNEIIWPLFHDLQTRCTFDPEYWYRYLDVNRKFARTVARNSRATDYIWVNDYHLMHLAHALRDIGAEQKTGFFLHIPFPAPDIFMKLPWREKILEALMEYDLIGFQTMRDRRNFLQCLNHFFKDAKVSGRGPVVTVTYKDRQFRVGNFPISIDYGGFANRASLREVADRAWYYHEAYPKRRIILGLDRLDYTKGIPERLAAFGNALLRFPELHQKVTLVQVVVPSREEVPEYQILKAHIEQLVSEINGRFTKEGWVPIHYMYRNLEDEELLAYYRASEIGLITPLKDGMNLIAKEYCACNIEENGVLILSEFAGAAAQLRREALTVNPYDIEGVADAIYQAFTMSKEERRSRMRKLRERIRRYDIFRWVDAFLLATFAKQLEDFPPMKIRPAN